jgi:hypothetical protein
MPEKNISNDPIFNLMPPQDESAESVELRRYQYGKNVFYIENPNSRTVTLEISPNGIDWFEIYSDAEPQAIVQNVVLCQFVRASVDQADADLKVIVLSGDMAQQ